MYIILIPIALIILATIVLYVSGGIISLTHPLGGKEEKIRENLLITMPLGTTMDDVVKIIESNEWDEYKIFDYGYAIIGGFPKSAYQNEYDSDRDSIIGNKHIKATIGKYWSPLIEVYVMVYLGFDEESKLIEISVQKGGIFF